MQLTAKASRTNALLISICTPDFKGDEAIESLAELGRLVTTLGFTVVGTQSQKQSSTKKVNVLGLGKLAEIAHLTGNQGVVENGDEDEGQFEEMVDESTVADIPSENLPFGCADVVVFDCDLSPSQLRNVENQLGVEVFDRTGIIIEIFSRHARTKTAKLQVEIARLNYVAPRLRETSCGDRERQMGKGAGETTLELNRRKVRDQLAELKRGCFRVLTELWRHCGQCVCDQCSKISSLRDWLVAVGTCRRCSRCVTCGPSASWSTSSSSVKNSRDNNR